MTTGKRQCFAFVIAVTNRDELHIAMSHWDDVMITIILYLCIQGNFTVKLVLHVCWEDHISGGVLRQLGVFHRVRCSFTLQGN